MKAGEPLAARVQQLRDKGAARVDPARMAQLESLVRRLQKQPDAVRAQLQERLQAALDALEERAAQVPSAVRAAPNAPRLPQLPRPPASREMQSVARFRRTWANGRAQERVAAATASKPHNAGPLNSHMLVLQSLQMMQALPGDYLRRFLTHVETLQWLEQAQAQGLPPGKPKPRKPR